MKNPGLKHIFYVHSHITYIVALSVIQFEKIPRDDLLFIFGRGYDVTNPGFNVQRLNAPERELAYVPTYGKRLLLFRHYSGLRRVKRIVDYFVGDDSFIAYLPSTRNFLMQFIATHSGCVGVNIIEEGLMTYTGTFFKRHNAYYSNTFNGRIVRLLKYLNHLNRSNIYIDRYYPEVSKIYTIYSDLNKLLPDHNIEVLKEIVTPELPDNYILHHANLFFLNALVEREITSLTHLKKTIELFLEEFLSNKSKLWIKFHPIQRTQADVIQVLQEKKVDYQVIPSDIPAEVILLKSHHLKVFGFHSSVLFYASIWGHNSYSLIKILEKIDPQSKRQYQSFITPDVFFEKVEMLSLDFPPGISERQSAS